MTRLRKLPRWPFTESQAVWWPAPSGRAWVSNGHFIVLAQRAAWLEPKAGEQLSIKKGTRWRRLPGKSVGEVRREYLCERGLVRRKVGPERDYVHRYHGVNGTRVRSVGGHAYDARYLALIEAAWPGCEWRTERRRDPFSGTAWAIVPCAGWPAERLVGVVLSMAKEAVGE